MSEKVKDPEAIKQFFFHKPIDYVKLNQLSEDFRKRFVPQQELSTEQAFWFHMSNPSTASFDASPVKVEAHSELRKVSLVNESLKKLKLHLAKFDSVVKIQTTPDALTKENFQKKSVSNNQIALEIPKSFENNDLKAQLQAKDTTVGKLKEHIKSMRENDKEEKVKHEMDEIKTINIELEHRKEVENVAKIPIATTVAPGMFKLDLNPLAPRLLQNREAHIYYLKHTQDQADIESLIYVQDTFPNAIKLSDKKVESPKTPDSNTPVLSSTGLKFSTSTCRSQPTGNKKNDRISQKPSSNRKNKVAYLELEGVIYFIRTKDTNLYIISLDDMLKTSLICLLSKTSKTKSWLWHRWLSQLNFDTLNKLAKDGLARGIRKLKFQKDHLCLASALGKSKKSSH
ncbi:retrovirus-related pol polyprotein from transposon TNT 1-94 [Tanacetum coccineum]